MARELVSAGHRETESRLKLDGQRVILKGRVFPDYHERAIAQAGVRGVSLSDYLMELIDRDTGRPPRRASSPAQEVLDISA